MSLRCIEGELIILDFVNTLHLTKNLTVCCIDELGKEGDIMPESTIVILELFESDS